MAKLYHSTKIVLKDSFHNDKNTQYIIVIDPFDC